MNTTRNWTTYKNKKEAKSDLQMWKKAGYTIEWVKVENGFQIQLTHINGRPIK